MSDRPQQRITREAERIGVEAFARECVALFEGDSLDPRLIHLLAGRAAVWGLAVGPEQLYWHRVWALRGLLWSWHPVGVAAVRSGCGDESWRVREMAAKVVARHALSDVVDAVAALCDDPVPRVRTAARRAVVAATSNDAS
jgi:hypothetical protein